MKYYKIYIPLFLSLLFFLFSCSSEEIHPDDNSIGYQVFCTVGICEESFALSSKSILGEDSEEAPFIKDSGYQLLIFNRRTKILESVLTTESYKESIEVKLNASDTYDLFVIGNMWLFDRNGSKVDFSEFFAAAGRYPGNSNDMYNADYLPYYRFDGNYIQGTSLRTELFSDVSELGIPYSGEYSGIKPAEQSSVSIKVKRLFSKVTLRVNHSGLSGDLWEDPFVNSSVHLRQVNCNTHPFIEKISAEVGDIIDSAADYELHPANGRDESFVFYVPENYGGNSATVKTPDEKTPQQLGERAGLVTYLEFEGVLDLVKGGGYGGSFRYQFCLGENNTDDFNVVRNRNHIVSLAFRTSTIFDGLEWKFDCEDGLNDLREFGLSADASGNSKLKSDGQVIAVRAQNDIGNKRTLYVFFNHSGGAANEYSTYIDAYKNDYVPADVSRSAIKVSCQDMSQDAIECTYESGSGKLDIWCSNPSQMRPGHEYQLVLTLYPGGESHTAVIRTCDDMSVVGNFDDYYVAQKRSVFLNGFCGNASVRVLHSDVDDAVSLNNIEGHLRYIGSEPVYAEGQTIDFYAYKPARNVSIAISSDDSFNDGEERCFDFSVILPERKVQPLPIVPIDGTEVPLVAWYSDGQGNRPEFDDAVFGQLLEFESSLDSSAGQWLGSHKRDDGMPGIFVRRLKLDNNTSLKLYMSVFGSLGKILVNSKDRGLYPSPVELEANTAFPDFSSEWNSGSEMTSDYFNSWDSSWNWASLSEIDKVGISDRWPAISNHIAVNSAGCSIHRTFEALAQMENEAPLAAEYLTAKFKEPGQDGEVLMEWKFSPGDFDSGINDTCGALAPFGKQSVSVSVTNMHSGEKYIFSSPEFNLKYGIVKLSTAMLFYEDEERGKAYVAASTVLAWILYEMSNNRDFNPQTGAHSVPLPLEIASSSLISYSSPGEIDSSLPDPYVRYFHNLAGPVAEIPAAFSAWRMYGYPDTGSFSFYQNWCWDRELMKYYVNSKWPLPLNYSFMFNGRKSSEILGEWYTDRDMDKYVRIQFNYNSIDDDLVSVASIYVGY